MSKDTKIVGKFLSNLERTMQCSAMLDVQKLLVLGKPIAERGPKEWKVIHKEKLGIA